MISFLSWLISVALWGCLSRDMKMKIFSLLRKMETRKGRGVCVSGGKNKLNSPSRFKREIQKLECSVNYKNSPLLVRGKGRSSGITQTLLCEVFVRFQMLALLVFTSRKVVLGCCGQWALVRWLHIVLDFWIVRVGLFLAFHFLFL